MRERSKVYPIYERIDQLMTAFKMKYESYNVEFRIFWDVDQYFAEELDGPRSFSPVLTLSGTMDNAYVTTCEEYIRGVWPHLSVDLIGKLLPALQDLQHFGAYNSVIPSFVITSS